MLSFQVSKTNLKPSVCSSSFLSRNLSMCPPTEPPMSTLLIARKICGFFLKGSVYLISTQQVLVLFWTFWKNVPWSGGMSAAPTSILSFADIPTILVLPLTLGGHKLASPPVFSAQAEAKIKKPQDTAAKERNHVSTVGCSESHFRSSPI